jgi:hypothetical protein
MLSYRPPVYTPDKKWSALRYFRLFGYVVVKDIYKDPSTLTKNLNNQIFEYFENAGLGFDRTEKNTWSDSKHYPTDGLGATQFNSGFHGIYHLPAQYDLRLDEGAQTWWQFMWENMTGDKDIELWARFERINFMPPSSDIKGKMTKEAFLHWDQNANVNSKFSHFQAVFSITDTDIETGTFVCVPRSHLSDFSVLNKEWAAKSIKTMVNVPLDYKRMWDERIALELKAGEMVIWDGRLCHGNSPNHSINRYRLVAYPTMMRVPITKTQREHASQERWRIFNGGLLVPGNYREAFGSGYTRPQWKQVSRGNVKNGAPLNYTPRILTDRESKLIGD